jgi:hypothetical protein
VVAISFKLGKKCTAVFLLSSEGFLQGLDKLDQQSEFVVIVLMLSVGSRKSLCSEVLMLKSQLLGEGFKIMIVKGI